MEIFKEIEMLIRQGNINEAQLRIEKINTKKLTIDNLAKYSEFLRRTGNSNRAINILFEVIEEDKVCQKDTNISILEEYGANLITLGIINKGKSVLKEINSPKSILFAAFAEMNEWNYEEAVKRLNAFLSLNNNSEYEIKIAKVNLLASLVASENSSCNIEHLLNNLLNSDLNKRLFLNVHEIAAQHFFKIKKFKKAQDFVNKCESTIVSDSIADSLFLNKWNFLIKIYSSKFKDLKKIKSDFNFLYSQANKINHYETLRDLDFHKAKLFRDNKLADKLFFGTKHEKYKERILKSFGTFYAPKDSYIIGPHKNGNIIDLRDYINFYNNPLIYKFVEALVLDFYKPISIYEMYSHIYPDNYYNTKSSDNQIHQLNARTKELFPFLTINSNNRFYSLTFEKFAIKKTNSLLDINNLIQNIFPKKHLFKSIDLAKKINVSERTAQRLIKEALGAGRIEVKEGKYISLY